MGTEETGGEQSIRLATEECITEEAQRLGKIATHHYETPKVVPLAFIRNLTTLQDNVFLHGQIPESD